MPETTSNIEFAHRIHEQGHSGVGPIRTKASGSRSSKLWFWRPWPS